MFCPGCQKDVSPIVEMPQSGKTFYYTCSTETCRMNLGPVQRQGEAPVAAAPAPGTASAPPARAAGAGPAQIMSQAIPAAGRTADVITQARARLAELDATVPALIDERTALQRMLRAADRKPRSQKSNVVPIDSATARTGSSSGKGTDR